MITQDEQLQSIADQFDRLAQQALTREKALLGMYLEQMIRPILDILERRIPGFDEPDEDAKQSARTHIAALEAELAREECNKTLALGHAFRGLQYWPHHEGLWMEVGTLCVRLEWIGLAMRVFFHIGKTCPWNHEARNTFGQPMHCYMGD